MTWFDVSDLWQGKALDAADQRARRRRSTQGLTGIKGAQGGIMMFGMMGQFLPAAAGALLATNPVLLGIGALFGGMGLAEDRKRKVQMRRQTARTQVRQFLDDVQFEVTNQLTGVVRDIQRELRDEFTVAARRAAADVHRRGEAGPGGRPADAGASGPSAASELDQSIAALTKLEAALGAGG